MGDHRITHTRYRAYAIKRTNYLYNKTNIIVNRRSCGIYRTRCRLLYAGRRSVLVRSGYIDPLKQSLKFFINSMRAYAVIYHFTTSKETKNDSIIVID